MVAIFTGLGAGFERGSRAQVGAGGLLGSASFGRGGEGISLNAATGNLLLQRQDEFLAGLGPDLAIARTYNSAAVLDDNGDHWRQSTDRRVFGLTGTVNTSGSTIKRVSADGSEITYTWNGTLSAYITSDGAGAFDKLTYSSGTDKWTWTDGDSRFTETYENAGSGTWRILTQADTDGNTLTFAYTSGKLTSITTQDGASITYTWTGNNITAVVTHYTDLVTSTSKTLTRTTYAYDGSNRLTSATVDLTPDNTGDSVTYVTTYTYQSTTNLVATITQTDGSSVAFTYDGSSRVTAIAVTAATSDTRTTTIAYSSDHTDITDPRGQVTTLWYDTSGQLTKVVAPPATTGATALNIQYTYDSSGNVTRITDGAGKYTDYTYDSSGNVLTVTDPNSVLVTRTYDANNNVSLETRTGTISSGSSSLYTRYVYDSENHLAYTISAEGYVTEYRYTTAGSLEYTVGYPQSAYSIGSTVPSFSTMQSWRDGLSDRSTTMITQYVYDARGGLTDMYAFGAATTGGASVTTEGKSQTHYVYNQAGQLLSRATYPLATETFTYDGLGRLLTSTDLNGGTTTIVFNDASLTTTVTTADGFSTLSTYNKAGDNMIAALPDIIGSTIGGAFGSALSAKGSSFACATRTTNNWWDDVVSGWNNFWSGVGDFVSGGPTPSSTSNSLQNLPEADAEWVLEVWGSRSSAPSPYSVVGDYLATQPHITYSNGPQYRAATRVPETTHYPILDAMMAPFVRDYGAPTSPEQAFHQSMARATDPFGARAFGDISESLSNGISEWARGIYPDSNDPYARQYIDETNRAHPFFGDPNHIPTPQGRRDALGDLLVGAVTGPIGASESLTARELLGVYGRFGTADAFAAEAYLRYQGFYDRGYALASGAAKRGILTAPSGVSIETVIGQETDAFARYQMRKWVASEGIVEGRNGVIQINRRLYDAFSDAWRVPDIQIPEANRILEGTTGWKWPSTPQIHDFRAFSGAEITVVRPTTLGGSYSTVFYPNQVKVHF